MTQLLTINLDLNPNVVKLFGVLITWHGIFTAIGIIVGVWLAVRIAGSARVNIDEDSAYSLGMIVVLCGIIGARALYVAERFGDAGINTVGDIFRLTEGGISIYGALIGGALGGWAWGLRKRMPSAAGADAAVFGMLLGMAIGRIGDIINGEHLAKASSLPWAVMYTHPLSPGFLHSFEVGPTHPAVAYELIGDLVILGIIALLWKRRPKSGVVFCAAFLLYAVMRFFVSFLRVDSKYPLLGLSTPQLASIFVMVVGLPLLVFFLRRTVPENTWQSPALARQRAREAAASRAERRRRLRQAGPEQ